MEGEPKITNLIIATILIFVILTLWQSIFFKPSTNIKDATPSKTDSIKVSDAVRVSPAIQGNESETNGEDTLFIVTTPLYEATFSANGGITSFKVKKIGKFEAVELIKEGSIFWADVNRTYFLENGAKILSVTDTPLTLTLVSSTDGKRKTFTFYPDKYLIDLNYEGSDSVNVFCKGNLRFTEKNTRQESAVNSYAIRKKTTIRINIVRLKDIKAFDLQEITWFGLRTKYFFSGILSLKNPGNLTIGKDTLQFILRTDKYSIYFGPLDYLLLKSNHKELATAFDFGSWIVKPFAFAIYFIMKGIRRIVPNYGFVIIIFALLMKIIFFPLSRKQVIAAKRMQELKPKLETLQKIYANDPQKLQKEMMELYKKYNVNPFSGCLTLIIQLPIFFALYQILSNSISLKGASFIFWIKDLSDKDPYYILPVLMGLTSIVLSMLQQTATDTQSKMLMYTMPVIMIFIFASLPSGIVLYWFTFNVLGIFEALLIKRLEGHHGT